MAQKNKYNLDKDGYDLSKDTDEVPVVVNNDNGNKKSHLGLWILLAILVVVGIAIAIVLTKGNDKSKDVKEATPIEQVEGQLYEQEEVVTTEGTDTPSEAVSEPVEENNVETPANRTAQPKPQQSATKPVSLVSPVSSTASNAGLTGDVEKDALNAIRGDFGNGQARKEALGDKYAEIQNRINEIYKEKGLL